MKAYKITRVYKHTEELEIQAESEEQALEFAEDMEFDRVWDDSLYDENVVEV